MKRHVIKTSDGSSTIKIDEMDETYHSSHGAIQEARHVFLKNGIETLDQNRIAVFEMGFGTGLNALLTYDFATDGDKSIHYTGIEAYPVEEDLLDSLNYVEEIDGDLWAAFDELHKVEWGSDQLIHEQFTLRKIHEKIENFVPDENSVDIVYYDAFGPRAQGAMWELDVLSKMHKILKHGGVLVTYCAQGQFKRNLKSLGFEVESLPGPPGKREMTRAYKRS